MWPGCQPLCQVLTVGHFVQPTHGRDSTVISISCGGCHWSQKICITYPVSHRCFVSESGFKSRLWAPESALKLRAVITSTPRGQLPKGWSACALDKSPKRLNLIFLRFPLVRFFQEDFLGHGLYCPVAFLKSCSHLHPWEAYGGASLIILLPTLRTNILVHRRPWSWSWIGKKLFWLGGWGNHRRGGQWGHSKSEAERPGSPWAFRRRQSRLGGLNIECRRAALRNDSREPWKPGWSIVTLFKHFSLFKNFF